MASNITLDISGSNPASDVTLDFADKYTVVNNPVNNITNITGNATMTVAALRSSVGLQTAQSVTTKDYGGGTWYYAGLADGDIDDNTGTVIITSDNKVWKRIYNGNMDVEWFGCKLDGTDNLAAFKSILTFANSVGGNINFNIGIGEFYLSAASGIPAITAGNIYFIGVGDGTLIKPTSGTYFNYHTNSGFTKGGGLKNMRIQYDTPDTSSPFITISQAANQRFENLTWYNGCKFMKAGNSTEPAYDIKFTKVTAVIANKGRAFLELANGAGFQWTDHDGISHMEASVPDYNTTSVMNTVPGTNAIDITGPWDSFFLDVFAEKLYRVVNANISGPDKTLFHFSIKNCTCDYIRDDVFHFSVDNLSAISQLEFVGNYMATWEGNGIYIYYQNGAGLYGLQVDGNKTIFAGKSALDIRNPSNSNPYYLTIVNNKFQMTSRLGLQYPAVHITSVLSMVLSNNVFGGGKLTPAGWEDNIGLVIDYQNAISGVEKVGNTINNYTDPTALIEGWLVSGDNQHNINTGFTGIGTDTPLMKFEIKPKTDIHVGMTVGEFNPSAVQINAFNDGGTLNIPMEFKASEFSFTGIPSAQMAIVQGGVNPGAISLLAYHNDKNSIIPIEIKATESSFVGVRPISFYPATGEVRIKGDAAGWSTLYGFTGSNDAAIGGYGAIGIGSTLSYYFIGQTFDNAALFAYPNKDIKINGKIILSGLSVFNTTSEPPAPAVGDIVEWWNGTNKKWKKSDGTTGIIY